MRLVAQLLTAPLAVYSIKPSKAWSNLSQVSAQIPCVGKPSFKVSLPFRYLLYRALAALVPYIVGMRGVRVLIANRMKPSKKLFRPDAVLQDVMP